VKIKEENMIAVVVERARILPDGKKKPENIIILVEKSLPKSWAAGKALAEVKKIDSENRNCSFDPDSYVTNKDEKYCSD
jgi:hypothetical protein